MLDFQIAVLESDKKDPELRRECTITLACMAHSLLMPNTIQPVLGAIQQVLLLLLPCIIIIIIIIIIILPVDPVCDVARF